MIPIVWTNPVDVFNEMGDTFYTSPLIVRFWVAPLINAALALTAYYSKLVSRSGAIGGFVVGTLIFFFLDWRGYVVLVTFFVLGSLATKVKYKEKAAKGIAQEDQGRRGAKHAFANCLTGLILGLLAWLSMMSSSRFVISYFAMLGYTAAFATALADTASSEIGQAYGRTTVLLGSWKRVPPGTEGAVSLEGTLAGILASVLLALSAYWARVISEPIEILVVVLAAFIGNVLESIIGNKLEKFPLITNEVTNFLNTVIGALAAILLYVLWTFSGMPAGPPP
jgi:uncharacterized protein (TIGR00297 family)